MLQYLSCVYLTAPKNLSVTMLSMFFYKNCTLLGKIKLQNSAGHSCPSITDKDNVFVDSSNRLQMKPALAIKSVVIDINTNASIR